MPMVPPSANINTSGQGASPLTTPKPENVLMTLADMKSSGALQTGKMTKFKQPNPGKPHPAGKKLKVLK